MAAYELKDRAIYNNRDTSNRLSVGDNDEITLQRLGKKPVLKVCFSIHTMYIRDPGGKGRHPLVAIAIAKSSPAEFWYIVDFGV